MRTAIFLAAVLISDALRNSSSVEGFYSENAITYLGICLGAFMGMDTADFVKKLIT